MGFEALPVDAGGEAEAAAPGAIAEFAQERRLGIGGLLGGEALGADDEGAIGGFDIDRVALHARQFQGDGEASLGFTHFGGGHALGGVQLLLELFEQIKGIIICLKR